MGQTAKTSRGSLTVLLEVLVLIALIVLIAYFGAQSCAGIGCTIKLVILVVCIVLALLTAFAIWRTVSRLPAKPESESSMRETAGMRGIVGDLRMEYESDPRSSKEIWRFDLLGDAAAGGNRSRLEVKMAGWWFEGELVNGEAVEIVESHRRGDGLTTDEVSVLDNGVVVRRVRARNTLRGVVSDFKVEDRATQSRGGVGRSVSITYKAWKFRVQRHDIHGNTLTPGVVEMVGTWFSGDLKDGDEVEITHDWRPGEELSTNQAFNVSTGITVQANTK
jgi:membrane protein implicated in regulation of membrane protease activity